MREAIELNHTITPVVEACFIESNPVPAKFGASMLGLCKPHARLPLAPISESSREVVRKALTDIGVREFLVLGILALSVLARLPHVDDDGRLRYRFDPSFRRRGCRVSRGRRA